MSDWLNAVVAELGPPRFQPPTEKPSNTVLFIERDGVWWSRIIHHDPSKGYHQLRRGWVWFPPERKLVNHHVLIDWYGPRDWTGGYYEVSVGRNDGRHVEHSRFSTYEEAYGVAGEAALAIFGIFQEVPEASRG